MNRTATSARVAGIADKLESAAKGEKVNQTITSARVAGIADISCHCIAAVHGSLVSQSTAL